MEPKDIENPIAESDARAQIQNENKLSPQKPNIIFEEYQKLDIRICKILSVERVPDTDKLYKMIINTGIDTRVVVSSIANSFSVDKLINKHLPFILNLEPRKIKGIQSTAMIILAETAHSKVLFQITPLVYPNEIPTGDVDKELTGATVI